MRPVLRMLACVAVLLLAGCTAKETSQDQAPEVGAVAGVIVSEAIEPIPGVDVRLEPTQMAAKSDLFGRFRFDDLDPGAYRLVAAAEGRAPETVSVSIEAGQTARPRLVLAAEPVATVRHETHDFQGFVPAWLGPADDAAGPVKDAIGAHCTCAFEMAAPDGLAGITLEAVWQDSIQRQDEATLFQWNVTIAGSLAGAGPSPLHMRILGDDLDLNGTMIRVSLVPDETWPAYDQSYQLFVTTWQGEEPPADWSRVRGDP